MLPNPSFELIIYMYYNVCIETDLDKRPCNFIGSSQMVAFSKDSVQL